VDETAYQKGHDYVTVLVDKDHGCVLDVLDGRKAETLEKWFKTQVNSDLSGLESRSMDMWDAYIKAVMNSIAGAEQKIAFDRFHVSKHFNEALDKVRRREHAAFMRQAGESPLSKSRFQWLTNSNLTDNRSGKRKAFLSLSKLNLETSRAWRIKETANSLWDYLYMKVAEEAWKKLLYWISHCRIPEMVKVGLTVKKYFWGILNAIRLNVTNGVVEAKNNSIQRIKRMACGFRNKDRFKTAILFHRAYLFILVKSSTLSFFAFPESYRFELSRYPIRNYKLKEISVKKARKNKEDNYTKNLISSKKPLFIHPCLPNKLFFLDLVWFLLSRTSCFA
jgi:transposase